MEKIKVLLRGCAITGYILLKFIFWPLELMEDIALKCVIFIPWFVALSGIGYYFGYYTLVIIPCLFPIAYLYAMQEERAEKERLKEQERIEQERLRIQEERKRRFPCSPWWNIPRGSTIIIDTCVWIEAYKLTDKEWEGIKAEKALRNEGYSSKEIKELCSYFEAPKPKAFKIWIQYLIKNAEKNDWTLFLPKEVIDEIAKKKEDRHSATGAAARAAHRCLMEAQATLLPKGRFKGEFKARVHGINLYADPVFVNLLKQDKSMRLYTLDNHVALVARQNIGDVERVYSRDQFEEFSEGETKKWA